MELWFKNGIKTPFLKLQQSHHYNSLEDAKKEIKAVGDEIKKTGLPKELQPMVIGITGYGNVAKGAMEIADLLPIKEISPKELSQLGNFNTTSNNMLYRVTFKENHISKLKEDSQKFDLQDYYQHPEKYENQMEDYIPRN